MNIIIKIIKRIIFSFGIIYSLDLILNGANLFLPINLSTIFVGSLLGPIGIGALFIIKYIV